MAGNDSWSGRSAAADPDHGVGPFASIERARDEIRKLKKTGGLPAGPITVWVSCGVYQREKTFELTSEDSGDERSPIVYRVLGNAEVRFVGGVEVRGFTPVRDTRILERIPQEARGHVVQADLRGQGIKDFGEIKSRGMGRAMSPAALELFFGDRPMKLARWPNEGWVKIAGVPDGPESGKFAYEDSRPERWKHAKDIWVHGFWTWDWADSYEKIKSVNTEKKVIETVAPHGVYGYKTGKPYYVLNLLEELDEPGEWYLDHATGVLYFWPPEPLENGKVYVSTLETLLHLKDVSDVTLRGFTFEITRGDAIKIEGGARNLIGGCTIRNAGNRGVVIAGGEKNGVTSCDIYETGDGGIDLAGGDRKTLRPGNNFAVNNHIHHYSRWSLTYRPAVMLSGVGNRVAHNLIHDAAHNAIQLTGNEHVIEFNEVHHVCMGSGDVGAFYMGRDWTERGNIIRYNFFHDLGELKTDIGAMAIYLDDWASGTTIFGNVCYKAGRAVLVGGGRNNAIENNIFVDCTPAVHVDSRGLGWAKNYFDGTTTTLTDRLKDMNYKQPPYNVRYPELLTLEGDEPALAKYNKIVHNISWGGRWLDLLDHLTPRVVEVKDNFTDGEAEFVAPARMDFRLREDSPVFHMGFQKIPIEEIGLVKDEYRTSLGGVLERKGSPQ